MRKCGLRALTSYFQGDSEMNSTGDYAAGRGVSEQNRLPYRAGVARGSAHFGYAFFGDVDLRFARARTNVGEH